MPFEIIRRKEGEESQKQEIRHNNVQISINDWGHLVIREFDEPKKSFECTLDKCPNVDRICGQCEHWKSVRVDDEHLIVFDRATTERILRFVKQITRGLLPF